MSTMLISFVLMIGMAATAKPMVMTLIGEKWLPCAPYLQLLCFVGMLYPLHALNLTMLNVKGRSDLFLKLEVIKKLLAIPIVLIGVWFGIKTMIVGMIALSFIAYLLNSYWSGKMINYSMKEQIMDIGPSFMIAMIMGVAVFLIGYVLAFKPIMVLCIQLLSGGVIVLFIASMFRLDAFMEMIDILSKGLRRISCA